LAVGGLMVLGGELAMAKSVTCTMASLERTVELRYETPGDAVPCEVRYAKPTEGIDEQVLWRAEREAGYCEARFGEFLDKLRGFGWSCGAATGGWLRMRREGRVGLLARVPGLIIIAVGLALLLDNLDVGGSPWRFFPSVITVIGVWALARTGFLQPIGPLVLIAVGVAVQLSILDEVPDGIRSAIWPVVVILVGLMLIFWRSSRGHATSDGGTSYVAVFHGVQDRVTGPLGQLQATSIFGSVELDLREARIEQAPAIIDVSCMFGGVDIRLPPDAAVENDVLALFGGVEDKRPATGSDETAINLRGTAIFGGLRLQD